MSAAVPTRLEASRNRLVGGIPDAWGTRTSSASLPGAGWAGVNVSGNAAMCGQLPSWWFSRFGASTADSYAGGRGRRRCIACGLRLPCQCRRRFSHLCTLWHGHSMTPSPAPPRAVRHGAQCGVRAAAARRHIHHPGHARHQPPSRQQCYAAAALECQRYCPVWRRLGCLLAEPWWRRGCSGGRTAAASGVQHPGRGAVAGDAERWHVQAGVSRRVQGGECTPCIRSGELSTELLAHKLGPHAGMSCHTYVLQAGTYQALVNSSTAYVAGTPVTGSPLQLQVLPGPAVAAGAQLAASLPAPASVGATVEIKLTLADQYGNPAASADGAELHITGAYVGRLEQSMFC